ncbi:hypothetical protein ACN38_g13088, partial [Penicillium nordicum]
KILYKATIDSTMVLVK